MQQKKRATHEIASLYWMMLRACLFLACFIPLQSLAQYVYMKQYTSADGLAGNSVYDVLQDDDGFIWFATDHGVSRFDGHQFSNFYESDGLADDEVIRLGKDHEHRIWFLGFNGKASYYLSGRFYDQRNSPLCKQTQLGSVFCQFLLSKNGTVYLVSNTDGFIEVKGNEVKKFSKNSLQENAGIKYSNGLQEVKMDTAGKLWIFSNDSIYIVKDGNFRYKVMAQRQFPPNIRQSFFCADGSCVIPGKNKLVRYRENFRDSAVVTISNPNGDYLNMEESGKNFWVLTMSGAYFFRDGIFDGSHQEKILDGKYCGHVFTDGEGNTWITPLRDGAYFIPSLDISFLQSSTGLASNDVICLADHPRGVLAAFANGSAQVVERSGRSIRVQPPLEIGGYIVDLVSLPDQQWQFVTGSELIICDKDLHVISKRVTGWTKSCCRLQDGSLLLGGGFKLLSLKNDELRVLYSFHNENRIYAIAEGASNNTWLGTEKGVYLFHDSTMRFMGEQFPGLTGRINDIHSEENGRLWIASAKNGLMVLQDDKLRTVVNSEGNISMQKIFMSNDSVVYAGSSKGLFVIRSGKREKFLVDHIGKADGLASEKINTLLEKDSVLWIGTDMGLQAFPLRNQNSSAQEVPAVLTSFTVNGKSLSPDSALHLNYHQNNIHLSVSGINFRLPQAVIYRYRIHDSDTSWHYTQNSSIDLPELAPGSYHIFLQAGTSAGNWSAIPLQVAFVIHPPFWKTWWFYLLAAAGAIAAGFFLFRYRYRLQLNNEARKRKLVEAELSALRAQMNPHFIFNSLNAIQDFIFQHRTEEANEYLAKFARLMRAILSQSRKRFVTIEEECELLKMYLELESLRFNHRFTWELNIDPKIASSEVLIPSMLLQPVVENSIKHGFKDYKNSGLLRIGFSRDDDFIRCEVEDNGRGRSSGIANNGSSLALSITKERLLMLNQFLHQPCTMDLLDLYNGGEPSGLKTIFRFPGAIKNE